MLALAMLGAAWTARPPTVQAVSASDIPGIPLPSLVVSGQLGGPIYDIVYSVDVRPGYVIVAGLSGTSGTDFDLYLFDGTATTVLSNQGLLAKSTGPTSSESLSYPSSYGGRYYIDLNGASDVEGTYTLTVQLVADTSTPVASLLVGRGLPTVNTTTVPAELTASAQLSGIAAMAFSPDGVTFGSWQTYTTETSWTFPTGDGVKTLWAKVRNGVGSESAPTSDSIVLDTQPPSVTSISPGPADPVAPRPTYRVTFNESIDPASWSSAGLVIQTAAGVRVEGASSYDVSSRTGAFTPSRDLVAGSAYIVTVGPVRDIAGNSLVGFGSWVVVPLQPTSLSLSASSSVIATGGSAVLVVRASGLDGADVILEARQGASDQVVATGPYRPAAGVLEIGVEPAMNTTYRVRFLGTPTTASASSGEVRVLVRRAVSIVGPAPSVTRTSLSGKPVAITAMVAPKSPTAGLSFRLYRYDPARRAYVYAGSFGRRTDADGRATFLWTPRAGRYYWRVAVAPTPEFANNTTPVYRWTITSG